VIYTRRDHVIFSDNLERDFLYMIEDVIYDLVEKYAPQDKYPEDWDYDGLKGELLDRFSVYQSFEGINRETLSRDELGEMLKKHFELTFQEKKVDIESIPDEPFNLFFGPIKEDGTKVNAFLRSVMLRVIDKNWMDNLLALDHLKEGIGLRGYAQKDPLIEYKREAFEIFADMIDRINMESVELIMKFTVKPQDNRRRAVLIVSANEQTEDTQGIAMKRGRQQALQQQSVDDMATNTSETDVKPRPVVRVGKKVGRNAPCPCGSGKKYKKCCGR
jgi:preprotein translocase subunit SecA